MEPETVGRNKPIDKTTTIVKISLLEKIILEFREGYFHIFFAISYLLFAIVLLVINGDGFLGFSLLSGIVFISIVVLSAVIYLLKPNNSKSPITLLINSLPFFIIWCTYELMANVKEHLIYPRVYTEVFYNLEMKLFGWIFGGMTPNHWFHMTFNSVYTDIIFGGVYLLHALIPMVFGLYLYIRNDRENLKFLAINFYTATLLAFILFMIFPSAAPWYIDQYGFTQPDIAVDYTQDITAGLGRIDEITGVNLFSWYYGTFEQNSFAAFPSVHAVYALSATLCIRQKWKKSLYLTIPYCLAIFLGAIYFNHHFIVDILCGIRISTLSYIVALCLKKNISIFPKLKFLKS